MVMFPQKDLQVFMRAVDEPSWRNGERKKRTVKIVIVIGVSVREISGGDTLLGRCLRKCLSFIHVNCLSVGVLMRIW